MTSAEAAVANCPDKCFQRIDKNNLCRSSAVLKINAASHFFKEKMRRNVNKNFDDAISSISLSLKHSRA